MAVVIPLKLAIALSIALLVNTRFRGSRSLLYTRRLIDRPVYFLSMQNSGWVVESIVLAEHRRATEIVVVILVAGLKIISRD